MAVLFLIPLPCGHGRLDAPQRQAASEWSVSAGSDVVSISIVLVNASDSEEAVRIGRNLVESRLAAAANVIGGVSSIYRWKGAVQEREEAQLIIKTRADLVEAVVARVRELHSYRCPGIVMLPVVDGNAEYLDWVAQATAGP